MRMGWNETGLMVWVRVQDPTPVESEDDERLWEGDSIISFMSTGVGSGERFQALLAPGLDPQQDEPRLIIRDHRTGNDLAAIELDVAITPFEGGYLAGFRYPWEIFGLEARPGTTLAYHIHLYALDGRDGERRFLGWSPTNRTHADPTLMMPLQLVGEVSPPRTLEVAMEESRERQQVIVYGSPDAVGQEVSFHAGPKQLGQAHLEKAGHAVIAAVDVPREVSGEVLGSIAVKVARHRKEWMLATNRQAMAYDPLSKTTTTPTSGPRPSALWRCLQRTESSMSATGHGGLPPAPCMIRRPHGIWNTPRARATRLS